MPVVFITPSRTGGVVVVPPFRRHGCEIGSMTRTRQSSRPNWTFDARHGQIVYPRNPEHARLAAEFPATLLGKIQKLFKLHEFEIEARGLEAIANAATAKKWPRTRCTTQQMRGR